MAQGDILHSERRTFTQQETGVCVVQLTDAACKNVNAYYNHEQFIGDHLIFHSDRTGVRQIYKVDTETGRIVQLTDAAGGVGGFAAAPALGVIYYTHGEQVLMLDVETLKADQVAERLPGCGPPALQDVSSCGRYLVLSARSERLL